MDLGKKVFDDLKPFLTQIDQEKVFTLNRNNKYANYIQTIIKNNVLIYQWQQVTETLFPVFDESYSLQYGYYSAIRALEEVGTNGFLRINMISKLACVFFEETHEVNGWYLRPKQYVPVSHHNLYDILIHAIEAEEDITELLSETDNILITPYLRVTPKSDEEINFRHEAIRAVNDAFHYQCLVKLNELNTLIPDLVSTNEYGEYYQPNLFNILFNGDIKNLLQ